MSNSGFILDGVTLGKTKFINSYNSLLDNNLVGYFNKDRRKFLKRIGLLTRKGVIITNKIVSRDYQFTFQKSASMKKLNLKYWN